MIVKVGYLISYDYEYLRHSLPLIYNNQKVHEIILVLDKDRLTWSGNKFEISADFFEWIKVIDQQHKIKIIEESFCNSALSPMVNETVERNYLYSEMGNCDWYIQLDCDEYFVNFDGFIMELEKIYLDKNKVLNPISVTARFAHLFKKTEKGFLVISPAQENAWIATSNPVCHYGRVNEENEKIESDAIIVHQSWAREEAEIYQKITNWGHKNDFNSESYFKLWKSLDEHNYKYVQNFHPLKNNDGIWAQLKLLNIENIEKLLQFDRNQIKRIFDKSKVM